MNKEVGVSTSLCENCGADQGPLYIKFLDGQMRCFNCQLALEREKKDIYVNGIIRRCNVEGPGGFFGEINEHILCSVDIVSSQGVHSDEEDRYMRGFANLSLEDAIGKLAGQFYDHMRHTHLLYARCPERVITATEVIEVQELARTFCHHLFTSHNKPPSLLIEN